MTRRASNTAVRWIACWILPGVLIAMSAAHANTVVYTLEDVVLDDGNAPMNGSFTWSYQEGDFENGTGAFTFLDIPYTLHDETDLESIFDIANSIEITLPGSVHDDGVDIMLVLNEALTPTTPATLDLALSHYEIGGNGFHVGGFLGGAVVPSGATGLADPPVSPAGDGTPSVLSIAPNPFRARTEISYVVARPGPVRMSIHDVRGREVATLVDRWHSAGRHSVVWNGVERGAGFYFVRYTEGGRSRVLKALLVR